MSKKYGICCANCQKPLNNEDDIYGTSCGHLLHSHCIRGNHGKSTECMHCKAYKPMLFKMHLTFDDTPLAGRLQEKNIEIINQLNEYERSNASLRSLFNAATRSVQQLESKVKTLKDGLKAKDAVVCELQGTIGLLETLWRQCYNHKNCYSGADVGNNTTSEYDCTKNDNNNKNKKKKLQQQQQEQETNNKTKNNKQSLNEENKRNWENKNPSNTNKVLKSAERNKCYNENDDKDEDVAASARNSGQYTLPPPTPPPPPPPAANQESRNDSPPPPPSNSVVIENINSTELSSDSPSIDVIKLGQRMDLKISSNDILDVFVYEGTPPFLTYVVEFSNSTMKDLFLKKFHVLNNLRKTKFLKITT